MPDVHGVWPILVHDWTADQVACRSPEESAAAAAVAVPAWLRATEDADCPRCGAKVGERCQTKGGNPTGTHSARDDRRRRLPQGLKAASDAEVEMVGELTRRRTAHRRANWPAVEAEARSLSRWPEGPPQSRPGVWVVGRNSLAMVLYVADEPEERPPWGAEWQAVQCRVRMLANGRWAWAVVTDWLRERSDSAVLARIWADSPHAGIEYHYIDAGTASRLSGARRAARRVAERYIVEVKP